MQALNQLERNSREFTPSSYIFKIKKLQELKQKKVFTSTQIIQYYHLLLFMKAYHEDNQILDLIEKESNRLSLLIKKSPSLLLKLQDSGLPFTSMYARFTHAFISFFYRRQSPKVKADSFADGGIPLHEILAYTLPIPEREHTNAEYTQEEMLALLGIKKNKIGPFLLDQVDKIPLGKEYVWRELKLFFRFDFFERSTSLPFNRLSFYRPYHTKELFRNIEANETIQTPLPPFKEMSLSEKEELMKVIRLSMLLTMRETDPSTFTDYASIRYVELDRGISVALYGMRPPHQLPLQSYVGFTMFKNGYPMSYGGSWILGAEAKFGMNIFEWFRGGESGWIFIQLLRVYKQLFHLKQIEIDAYQFGKDNMDGIKSGAFWFYYRYGFRPIRQDLKKLAQSEWEKIKRDKQYRTDEKKLIRLADANMKWTLQKIDPMPWNYMQGVSRFIHKQFAGDRSMAEKEAIRKWTNTTHFDPALYPNEISEWALLSLYFQCLTPTHVPTLIELVQTKSSDPYRYNQLLIQLFAQLKTRPINANT